MTEGTQRLAADVQDVVEGVWYLAGPMRGLPAWNWPLFDSVMWELRERGYTILSPHEINADAAHRTDAEREQNKTQYLRKDILALLSCSGIIMLPGWKRSQGASLEHYIAVELGLDIRYYRDGRVE